MPGGFALIYDRGLPIETLDGSRQGDGKRREVRNFFSFLLVPCVFYSYLLPSRAVVGHTYHLHLHLDIFYKVNRLSIKVILLKVFTYFVVVSGEK